MTNSSIRPKLKLKDVIFEALNTEQNRGQRTVAGTVVPGPCVTLDVHPVHCPILCCKFASFNASILVIFVANILALQASNSTKKEASNLEFIKAFKLGVFLSLFRIAPLLPGLDYRGDSLPS